MNTNAGNEKLPRERSIMLSDHDIIAELNKGPSKPASDSLIHPFPSEGERDWNSLPLSDPQWNEAGSPIQPASIDLHVGHIYIPGARAGSLGGEGCGALSHTLRPGHSVVVSTYERINLPASLGGIVFPPSKLSSSGILVANLGHIDPGFAGHLRFTIINMGGSDFSLVRATVAVGTLLLFRLHSPSRAPWFDRHRSCPPKGEPDRTEINALAKDFANVESRIDRITRATVRKLRNNFGVLAVLVPALLGVALGVWTIWFETGRSFADRIEKDDQSISDLRVSVAKLETASEHRAVQADRELVQVRNELDLTKKEVSDLRSRVRDSGAPATHK
jgi:deoxycytidine triphosphate deaminase